MSVPKSKRKDSKVQFLQTQLDLVLKTIEVCKRLPKSITFNISIPTADAAREAYHHARVGNSIFPKTKIEPINNTEFLKIRWFLTPTGKVVKKPDHKSVVRMRRKLKKLHRKVEAGEMTIEDVYMSWQSWNAHIGRTNSKRERREIKLLFKKLFGKEADDVYKDIKGKRNH